MFSTVMGPRTGFLVYFYILSTLANLPGAEAGGQNGIDTTISPRLEWLSLPSDDVEATSPSLPPFDADVQRVSTTGAHAFVSPGPTDARGLCPGLNAMANHGYLPHNGVATVAQFVRASQEVFGMAPDLGSLLAIYGAVLDGSLDSWSIEGGPHIGIGGSHNNYESDSSPLKSDLHQYGSNSMLIGAQFQFLYNLQSDPPTANYDLEIMRTFRKHRFEESIAKNPVFYYGPIAGTFVTQAAHAFIFRFMANKSQENPEGVLDRAILKSFMSIHGPEENLTWIPGQERIPDNFYRRNPTDEYSIPYFLTDALYLATIEPRILIPGCNGGTVNSYDLIDPAVLTHGAYSLEQAIQNPVCFSLAFLSHELSDITGLTTPITALLKTLTNVTSVLGCTPIDSVNTTALSVCPGFGLYGGPSGYVAEGAIQN